MKIAIVGYGKMGKAIEEVALNRGHEITYRINSANQSEIHKIPSDHIAIEFTRPDAAVENISILLKNRVKVVTGTTGWLAQLDEISNLCKQQNSGFFYAPNFSPGVNIFFAIQRYAAGIVSRLEPDWDVQIEETHHIHKKDAPSGTAIELAEITRKEWERFDSWKLVKSQDESIDQNILPVQSFRIDETPGTHVVKYEGKSDQITLQHVAHNRNGFATGAVMAAEFLSDKTGIFTMKDLLQL